MRLLKSVFLVTLCLFFLNIDLCANRNVNDSIALSEKLNELEMFDLSLYLIDKTIRENPDHKDLVMVQKAQTFFTMRKNDEGTKIINAIKAGSPAFAFSRYVLGTTAIARGENVTGARALEDYCAYMKNRMPEKDSALAKQFIKGVTYLIHAYKTEGKLKQMEKATAYLEWEWSGDSTEAAPDDPNEKYFKAIMNAQSKLDAAEIMKRNEKPEWKKTVEETIPPLKDVYWTGRTQYTGLASIEIAKAYSILEKYDEALKELKDYWDLIKALDEGYREEGLVPPSSKAYLIKGNCYIGLGEKATAKEDKIKNFFSAAKNYLFVVAKYDQEKCYETGKAVAGFNNAKRLLKVEGKNLKWPENIKLPGGFDRKRGDDLFNKEKYAEAIPLYMEILQSEGGRTSAESPEILKLVALCYINTGKILESLTLATYLGEYFPEDKSTPEALLAVGETLWKEYKKSPTTPAGLEAQDKALMLYKTYLKHCPTHKFADEISARSAKVYYDRANKLAVEANKMPNGPEKIKKNEEAREAFKQAIPIYQHIMDNYLHTDQGKSSAYLLSWCYTNSRQYVKGAEAFAKFADAEYGREKKEKRNFGQIADAKFRVAENYTRAAADLEKEAKQMKKDAENAPTEESLKTSPPKDGEKVPLSEEALIKKSEEIIEKAKGYFAVSVTNLNELLDKWMKAGGRLTEATTTKDKDKIKQIEEKATSLLAWSHDGTRNNPNAIKAFKNFIDKYPKHKEIPRSMLRLGMLYLEEDKPNEAANILNELSAKYPEEGKKALPKLARTMYELKRFDKSIDAAEKIFAANPGEIPVGDIKWIARNLYDCDGTHPEKGALISLQACNLLNKKINEKDLDLAAWIGKDKAKAMANNPEEIAKMIAILKEQLLYFTGNAAFRAKQYEKAIKAFTKLLDNSETPYFLQGHLLRAQSFMGNKEPQKALDNDFNAISLYLYSAELPESIKFENQCRIGDTYVLMGDYNKALGAYSFLTMTLIDTDTDKDLGITKKKVSPAEEKKQRKWLGYAVFMSACCENKLGNKEKTAAMVEVYRKNFNQGKYQSKLAAPPTPEEGMKQK